MDAVGVREFFDQVASTWEAMRSAWYDEKVIEELATRARVDPTMTVLDVGTGTGFVAAGLAHRVRKVVAVDNSSAMLDVARRNFVQLAIDNVELTEADLDSLPYPDDCIDAAVANMVLHHAEDPAAMIQEMARVTKPGAGSRSPTQWSTLMSGCEPSTPMCGWASAEIKSWTSSTGHVLRREATHC